MALKVVMWSSVKKGLLYRLLMKLAGHESSYNEPMKTLLSYDQSFLNLLVKY